MNHSYIVLSKETGKAVYETFQKSVAYKVNTKSYLVMTAKDYLESLNRKISNTPA